MACMGCGPGGEDVLESSREVCCGREQARGNGTLPKGLPAPAQVWKPARPYMGEELSVLTGARRGYFPVSGDGFPVV